MQVLAPGCSSKLKSLPGMPGRGKFMQINSTERWKLRLGAEVAVSELWRLAIIRHTTGNYTDEPGQPENQQPARRHAERVAAGDANPGRRSQGKGKGEAEAWGKGKAEAWGKGKGEAAASSSWDKGKAKGKGYSERVRFEQNADPVRHPPSRPLPPQTTEWMPPQTAEHQGRYSREQHQADEAAALQQDEFEREVLRQIKAEEDAATNKT